MHYNGAPGNTNMGEGVKGKKRCFDSPTFLSRRRSSESKVSVSCPASKVGLLVDSEIECLSTVAILTLFKSGAYQQDRYHGPQRMHNLKTGGF